MGVGGRVGSGVGVGVNVGVFVGFGVGDGMVVFWVNAACISPSAEPTVNVVVADAALAKVPQLLTKYHSTK